MRERGGGFEGEEQGGGGVSECDPPTPQHTGVNFGRHITPRGGVLLITMDVAMLLCDIGAVVKQPPPPP